MRQRILGSHTPPCHRRGLGGGEGWPSSLPTELPNIFGAKGTGKFICILPHTRLTLLLVNEGQCNVNSRQ